MDALLVYNYITNSDCEIQSGGVNTNIANNIGNNIGNTKKSTWSAKLMYFVSLVIFVYALNLSYKRNNGFHAGSMLAAYCCTTMYLVWVFFNPINDKDAENKN